MATKQEKLETKKLSDDDIQDMFTESFESEIASMNNIDSFECTCKRETGSQQIKMEVMVVGMAGSPTIDDFKSGKIKNVSSVVITREGKGSLSFKLCVSESIRLNMNDYILVYESL